MASSSPPPQHDDDDDGRQAAIAFVWVLIAFKVATMVLIFVHLRTFNSFVLLVATFWYWIPIIGFLVAGPLLWRYRLLRLRARRKQLLHAEWTVESDPAPTDKRPVSR